MKTLFKLYPIILLSLLTTNKSANAQAEAPKPPTTTAVEVDVKQQAKTYTAVFDSLLLEERYRNVIQLGELLTLDREPEISKIPISYLICAYHFIGNEERSKKLLNQKIVNYNYDELISLLVSSDIPLIKYFTVKEKREPIITKAINDYKKNVKATDKVAGEQIIRFYINDQLYRKLKYAYKEDDRINQEKRYQLFKFQDSIQNANVLAFYRKHQKYFGVKEVGEAVSWYQPIILSHYDNIELRQTFFKDLLEKAVREGRMEKTNYVHFILRTESFTDPDFFKNLERRMEEVRKEYDLPNYLWNPF
ncbi:MAG: hypothetical protein BGO31_12940 [Bacteroidetes bacterium 43-16]|nr:MAG: hypothetical protein BGO31_12940 [Bacteroidetes bacterium 43-16]